MARCKSTKGEEIELAGKELSRVLPGKEFLLCEAEGNHLNLNKKRLRFKERGLLELALNLGLPYPFIYPDSFKRK